MNLLKRPLQRLMCMASLTLCMSTGVLAVGNTLDITVKGVRDDQGR